MLIAMVFKLRFTKSHLAASILFFVGSLRMMLEPAKVICSMHCLQEMMLPLLG